MSKSVYSGVASALLAGASLSCMDGGGCPIHDADLQMISYGNKFKFHETYRCASMHANIQVAEASSSVDVTVSRDPTQNS